MAFVHDGKVRALGIGNIRLKPRPTQLPRYIKSDIARWGDVVRRAALAGSQRLSAEKNSPAA